MFRRFSLTCLFVLALASSVGAQSLPCVRFPYQAAVTIPLPPAGESLHDVSGAIALPASPVEIEQLSIRLRGGSSGAYFESAKVTAVLTGKAVTHGIDLPNNNGAQPMLHVTDPNTEADMMRQMKLYADPSSSLGFEFHAYTGSFTSQIDVTVVGRLVSVGCWIGPQ